MIASLQTHVRLMYLFEPPRSVVKDEDLGISRCMGEKSRALFALCDCAIYPCTLVRSYLMDLKR